MFDRPRAAAADEVRCLRPSLRPLHEVPALALLEREEVQHTAERTRNVIAALIALPEEVLDAGCAGERWSRAGPDLPVPVVFRAPDAQFDLIALGPGARWVAVGL